ncbi:hypothetical protein GCM10007390_38850 [Persicitalea jodogahamensis]|uniref:Uncharacterized protein n=1 Tax=Persicitalea jodogahamensis TaxID=402147 RepID=A0A8J3DBS8_9BACT|nr:hypothetical protein GCM10007390_38850 [Persicitalea jodogahamensis]
MCYNYFVKDSPSLNSVRIFAENECFQKIALIMFMNIVALVFYTLLLGASFIVGRWLERHEKDYDRYKRSN